MNPAPSLRPFLPGDRDGVIALIDGVLREYGQRVHLADADADLLDIPGRYPGRGGAFVVLADPGGRILGTHAALPLDPAAGVVTFRRLYLHPELRGGGQGRRLMDWAIGWAEARGFVTISFWSDALFHRAHRFFEHMGFSRTGEERTMHDSHEPYREYRFTRKVSSVV